MTDQMDRRLQELVTKLAAAAPEAPPFPQPPVTAARRSVPSWALAAAGAVAVLLIIGLPFVLFGGGRRDDPVISSPTTTPVTTAAQPTSTTVSPTTTVPDANEASACTPQGLLVRTLSQDGAAGRIVTPLNFVNVSGGPCTLADPVSVTGIGEAGDEIAAQPGTHVPINEDAGPLLAAGEARTMLLETGTGCEGGRLVGPAARSARITLATGDVTVPFSGDLGCTFGYSGFGGWIEGGVTVEEQTVVDAIRAFASDPGQATFDAIPFAETVTLSLGPAEGRQQDADTLRLPENWMFETPFDGFRGYVGPFSALDLLAQPRPVGVTGGQHDHCASPPMPPYPGFEDLRQVSIQPTDATSCLEWWTVDLFLTADGTVAGITLDLFAP